MGISSTPRISLEWDGTSYAHTFTRGSSSARDERPTLTEQSRADCGGYSFVGLLMMLLELLLWVTNTSEGHPK